MSRSGGDITEAMTVYYTASGTASPTSNADYTALSGSATIAANAAYANITVTITDDGSAESTETVILTLDEDETYLLGSSEATLFIWDDDGDFFQWTGAEDESWMNADNWAGSVVPGAGDIVVFDGTYDGDVTLSGPLSPYAINATCKVRRRRNGILVSEIHTEAISCSSFNRS